MLQHRGQDSAGMVTLEGQKFIEHKANGLVKDVFNNQKTMDKLKGIYFHLPIQSVPFLVHQYRAILVSRANVQLHKTCSYDLLQHEA